jgi:prepilin peptidase dependent protein B
MLKNKGFSLIELMIAIVVGLFALTAIMTLLTNNLSYGKTSIDMLRLNQEMRLAMEIMSDDIRRAGYWNNSQSMVGNATVTNPYAHPNFPLTISTAPSSPTGKVRNCITYAYDKDNSSNTPSSDELFGFALSNNQILTGFPTATNNCDSITGWSPITNPDVIKVNDLIFTSINPTDSAHQLNSAGGLVCIREIKIQISAELTKNPSIKNSMEKTIRVRNDEIRRAPATSC